MLRAVDTQRLIEPEDLDKFVGQYERLLKPVAFYTFRNSFEFTNSVAKNLHANITRDGDALFIEFEGSPFPQAQIYPESKIKFFAKGMDLQITFNKTDLAGVIGLNVQYDNDGIFLYRKKFN